MGPATEVQHLTGTGATRNGMLETKTKASAVLQPFTLLLEDDRQFSFELSDQICVFKTVLSRALINVSV